MNRYSPPTLHRQSFQKPALKGLSTALTRQLAALQAFFTGHNYHPTENPHALQRKRSLRNLFFFMFIGKTTVCKMLLADLKACQTTHTTQVTDVKSLKSLEIKR